MLHRITTKLTVFTLFALLFLPVQMSEAFTDTQGHYNEDAIDYLYEKGVVEGYDDGSYAPEGTINRAEFVKILIESKYPGQEYGTNCFPDVGTGWYAPYVCYAEDLRVIEGYDDGYFKPANEINLAEALKIVLETYEIEFTQYSDNWLWYAPYQRTADDLDLLYRIDTDIEHKVTRGEMAQFVYNVESYLEGETPEVNGEVTELTFDDTETVDAIPNVVILEFAEDDEWRADNGNVQMDGLIERFYEDHDDEFDMLFVIDAGNSYDGNGVSDGNIARWRPSNIGFSEQAAYWTSDQSNLCTTTDNSDCSGFPEHLRYIQQSGDNYSGYIFKHEIGHYWSARWQTSKNDACYEEWAQNALYNGHWTQLSVLGETTSPVSYWLNSGAADTYFGEFTDNNDGTFTLLDYSGGYSELLESAVGNSKMSDLRFNYLDLYAMGLMDEADLASKDMYTITDPEFVSYSDDETVITGDRIDVDLDDFKNLLLEKETCEETGTDYYYTGDGSRETHPDDPNPDFAENPKVGIILIKYPDEPIPNSKAYEICQVVNYEWPEYWSDATYGLSTLDIKIDGDDPSPDCADLYAE